MNELNLGVNETLMFDEDSTYYSLNNKYMGYRELYVTNYNIILVERTTFRNQIKTMVKYSFNDINIVNDQPHIYINNDDQEKIVFSFKNGIVKLGFTSRREAKQWYNKIMSILTGVSIVDDNFVPSEIFGSRDLANALYDTVDLFKGAFNKKEQPIQQVKKQTNQFVASHCKSCGAPLSGRKGSVVVCEYCDTQQQL